MSPRPARPALPLAGASSAAATEAASSSFSSSSTSSSSSFYGHRRGCCDSHPVLSSFLSQYLLLLPSPAPAARRRRTEPLATAPLHSGHEEAGTGLCRGRFVAGCWNASGSKSRWGGGGEGGRARGRREDRLFLRFWSFSMNRWDAMQWEGSPVPLPVRRPCGFMERELGSCPDS